MTDGTTTAGAADADLVERARAGSREAFCHLVQRHHAAVRAYVAGYLRGRDVVDDLAQEVFLGAHKSFAGYRAEVPFRHWLLSIARHQVIDHLRADKRRRNLERGKLWDAVVEWQIDRAEADERRFGDHDRRLAALAACLDELAPAQAELVIRHYGRAEGSAEIAQRLRKTDGAVRMTLLRIRQALRACVQGRIGSEA